MFTIKLALISLVTGLEKTLEASRKGRAINSDQTIIYVAQEKSGVVRMTNKPTKAQLRRWVKLIELGCIICGKPAEIHHTGTSMGCKKNHDLTLPLCPTHHRTGGYSVAIHAGKTEFESKHGTEKYLLEKVERLIGF